jgi:hypothetical protein
MDFVFSGHAVVPVKLKRLKKNERSIFKILGDLGQSVCTQSRN